MTIQELLDKHEAFKLKGFDMTEVDIFNRLLLKDDMELKAGELKSEYVEEKLCIDKDKALRAIELKAEKDEDNKTLRTDKMIDAKLKIEFYDRELKQATTQASYDLLLKRASSVIEYTNAIKLHIKKDFSL